jgi:hypothetical protein
MSTGGFLPRWRWIVDRGAAAAPSGVACRRDLPENTQLVGAQDRAPAGRLPYLAGTLRRIETVADSALTVTSAFRKNPVCRQNVE